MALQTLPNFRGALFGPVEPFQFTTAVGNVTLDAAGESTAIVGYINLSTGPGTSKTISAAGSGKIHWMAGSTLTFNNAGTNIRVGVNDVGATGLEDGTHDVFADLTGGGGGITAGAVNRSTMTSGTKTIADGDLVAIVVEMTARGGGADSVQVTRGNIAVGLSSPHGTVDNGTLAKSSSTTGAAYACIEFDDGTIGWLDNHLPHLHEAHATFSSSSTPDEYALVFQMPFKAKASGLYLLMSAVVSTDDFEAILYSDPLGTPVAERTITQDADLCDTGMVFSRKFATTFQLEANTDYAIALRPTTTNALAFQQMNFGTNGANIRKALPFGVNFSMYSRSNQTGAFGSQSTTILPSFGVWLSDLSDDASSGGVNRALLPSGVSALG